MDNTGYHGSWTGLFITGGLWILSSLTMSNVAMACTALAGVSTVLYNIWKYNKEKTK